MVKWSENKQCRDFCAHDGGYNVTGALMHYDMVKPEANKPSSPGLPYKLRKRMVRELGGKDCLGAEAEAQAQIRSARASRLFWTAVLYASVLAMWVAVWWYAGVQYGK